MMDTNGILLVFLLGLAVVAVWAWKEWLHFHTNAAWNAKNVLDDFNDAIKVIQKVAPAADQLVKLQELSPAKRRDYVVDTVIKLLPNLDPGVIEALVEWWIVAEKANVAKPVA